MNHSLRRLIEPSTTPSTPTTKKPIEPILSPYKRFSERINHSSGHTPNIVAESKTIERDQAFQTYLNYLKGIRNNQGHISPFTLTDAKGALRNFFHYSDLPITDNTLSKLIQYKRLNKESRDIEEQLQAFVNEEPSQSKARANRGARILGIFRANYAPLDLRINTHYDPIEETCTEGIFKEIYSHLTPEQQDMIQWGLYLPQRATATYRIPLNEIDLSRQDYAVIWIQAHHKDYSNKARVKHPALIPIQFAKQVVANAKEVGRRTIFPNHESQWKQITALAKREYNVRLVSNYTRKLFEAKASKSKLSPAIAAYLMGDKTKLNATGHMPLIYNIDLRFIEEIIEQYRQSGLEYQLDLNGTRKPHEETIESLKIQIAELQKRLALVETKAAKT